MRHNAHRRSGRAGSRRIPVHPMPSAGWPKWSSLPYRIIRLVGHLRYARYLLASAIALGADLAMFFGLLHVSVPAVEASIFGYLSGLGAHWLLSSRLVFADSVQPAGAGRNRQQLLFILSALLGLLITTGMIKGGLEIGIQPGLSKLAAIVVSFHATYILRRIFIFV